MPADYLAQAVAEDRWRLNRARALENSILALGQSDHFVESSSHPEADAALAQGRTWMAHAHQLHLLTTYENRIRRSVEKNTAEIRALQAERKAAVAKAEREAMLLVQLAEAEGGDYSPPTISHPNPSPLASHEIKMRPCRINSLRRRRFSGKIGFVPPFS